jgi:hypothetical protein
VLDRLRVKQRRLFLKVKFVFLVMFILPFFNGGYLYTQASGTPKEPKKIVGLAIVVYFSDEKANVTWAEANDFFYGVRRFERTNSAGSVYDWFLEVSNGLFEYTNVVAPIITMPNNRSSYGSGSALQDAITTYALNVLNSQNFDMSKVTVDANNRVAALNIFCNYAGTGVGGIARSYNGGATVNGIGFRKSVVVTMGTRNRSALNSGANSNPMEINSTVPNTVRAGRYQLRIVVRPTNGEWKIATLSLPDAPTSIDFTVR